MTSKQWLQRHQSDLYVQRSVADGYRSRAVYKLIEIDQRDKLLSKNDTVLDLGAAPGGWSQWAAKQIGPRGTVVAVDILRMDAIVGVRDLQMDLEQENCLEMLTQALKNQPVDVVLCDMAPNLSGVRSVDQARAIGLAELALDTARALLAPNGKFLIKVFHGVGFEPFRAQMFERFQSVKSRKPKASRAQSREIYLLGSGSVVS